MLKNFALFAGMVFATSLNAQENGTFTVGAVGDSITTAFNSVFFGSNPQESWATGSSSTVNSHYQRIQALFPDKTVQGVNRAVPGHTSAEIGGQIDQLLEDNPDYVAMAIGANDLCAWPKDDPEKMALFESRIRDGIDKLVKHNQDVKVMLAPVPNLVQLWGIGKGQCQWMWDLFSVCTPVLHSSRTPEERAAFQKRNQEMNETLAKVAADYSENVKFNLDIWDYAFQREDLSSIDCFHPSVKGQSLISELTWQKGWFSELKAPEAIAQENSSEEIYDPFDILN